MPSYDCPDCNKSFDSREARTQHHEDVHETGDGKSHLRRLIDIFSSKKKFAALIFGIIMVGLPLGGVIFYSSLAPEQTPSTGGGDGYRQTPPVGYGITSVPQPADIPEGPIFSSELTPDQQVYLLLQGGPEQIQSGASPAVLIQYSCTDCQETVQQIETFAQEFNGGDSWVYVAPNTRMNQTIAMTAYRNAEYLDAVNTTTMKDQICQWTSNRPVACIEDAF
jgi:DNA-directed RNA polymerase subunit RPC12/RpoP